VDDPQKELELGTHRSTDRVVNKPKQADDIPTVCDEPDRNSASSNGAHAARPAMQAFGMQKGEEASSSGRGLVRQESTKAANAAIVTLKGGQAKGMATISESFGSMDSYDMEMGPSVAKYGKPGETTLSISDSDDSDDDAPGFAMARWKRFYHWNRKKPAELLKFLWKRFDPKAWSVYCATYRQQDALFAAFQGENIIHGFACRLEQLMSAGGPAADIFGVLHTMVSYASPSEQYKVVGVFIVKGGDSSGVPRDIAEALATDLEQWQLSKADPKDPLIRQFVSGLITGQSPVQQFDIVATRELL